MPGIVESTRKGPNSWRVASRRFSRMEVQGFSVGITDENSFTVAVAENISQGGLKLSGLPPRFHADKFIYRAVVSGGGKSFHLIMKPCWRHSSDGGTVEMGFKVIDAPWEWCQFTDPELAAA